jgi:hypothetical protein
MTLNTSRKRANEGSTTHYGHADYEADKAAGLSDSAIKAKIDANPSKMGNGGVGGQLYKQIAAGANSSSSGSGGGGYKGGSVGSGAGGYTPPNVNFNPGGIDMGGDDNEWSNEEFIRELAKERAQAFLNGGSETNTITNDIEQNIGNKGDWTTNIGDGNTISNSNIGNDYSLNLGSINNANKIY